MLSFYRIVYLEATLLGKRYSPVFKVVYTRVT